LNSPFENSKGIYNKSLNRNKNIREVKFISLKYTKGKRLINLFTICVVHSKIRKEEEKNNLFL